MTESLASARLWLAFLTMLLVSGIANTFPVFFPPLFEEFGGSRAATASTVTLLTRRIIAIQETQLQRLDPQGALLV